MEDVAAMLARAIDSAGMGGRDSTLIWRQKVLSCLPNPHVSTAARLSHGVAARAPDGVDRISRLPDKVLREVVSRLPAKDAARTAVLSKRWRRVWSSTPLVLVDARLHARAAEGIHRFFGRAADPRDLTAAVSAALAAHPGPFRCVYLTGSPMEAHQAEIARWLQLLAAKGVQELVFVNRARTIKVDVDLLLPATLFSCTSLTKLYIGFSWFPDTAILQRAAAFPYLRELGLCFLLMKEHDLAFLLDRCPVLEKLRIIGSQWPVRIRVQTPEPQPAVRGDLLVHRARNNCGARLTPGEAPAVGCLVRWRTHQHERKGQDCSCTEAAVSWNVGAWNAQTRDRQHHYQGWD